MSSRLLVASGLVLGLVSIAAHGEPFRVHFTGGPGEGHPVWVELIAPDAEIVELGKVTVCQEHIFDPDRPPPFYMDVRDWDTGLILLWQRFDANPGGVVEIALPPSIGYCGDGLITGGETCDTLGNIGCDPQGWDPACLSCGACGCGSVEDCPMPTSIWRPCGFGRCESNQRPVFYRACIYGICMFPYTCEDDPSCPSPSCTDGRETQLACASDCLEACRYNLITDCWTCGDDGELLPPPCSSPDDTDCLLDPDQIGTTCSEGALGDRPRMTDEFALGGFTEEETRTLLRSAEQLESEEVPLVSAPAEALLVVLVATTGCLLVHRRRRHSTDGPGP